MPTDKHSDSKSLLSWPVEWLRIASPVEAEELSSLSWDSIKRNHPDKVVHVSARRRGMRVGDALMIGSTTKK
jgi:hypothetical protein